MALPNERPAHLVALDRRHQAAFREAILRADMKAALREWRAWLADHAR